MSRLKRSSPTTTEAGGGLPIRRDVAGNAMLHAGGGAITAAGLEGVLALAIASAPTGMVVADPNLPDCPIVFCNPAFSKITGYPPEEVLGRNCRFLQGPGTEKDTVRALRRAIAERQPITVELTNHRRDGRRFVNELRMAPVFGAGGELLAYVGIQHDVTARKRAEKETLKARREAERASKEKSDFLAFMSHEVRTPLHGVMGTLSLLLDTTLDAEQRAYAETARRCGLTLLETVNELLDLSRIEAGKLVISQEPFALAEVVKEVLDVLAPAAAEKGLDLSASLDHLLPARFIGDASRLRQVLINLGDNAVKFTHRGSVEIRLAALPDGRIGFAVTDTGIGIPPRLRATLFSRFAQAEPTGEQGGSGLGLAICKRLVALMGGQIAVDSTPGRGSTFFFDLPLTPLPESGSPPARLQPAPTNGEHPPAAHGRILLAEDGKANQLVAAAILRKAGYTVELARDGAEAAAAAESGDYDLILMDVRMPLMDGFAATRAIRALQGSRGRVPIIAMTAAAMPGDAEKCLDAGMDGHLAKPLDRIQLLAAVERVLESRPRRPRAPAPADEPVIAAPLLDRETLEELRAAVGPGRLPRLITVFTQETQERVQRILGLSDHAAIEDEAHGLKAAAATFGAAALRDAAKALEEACRVHDENGVRRVLAGLSVLAERTIAAFPGQRAQQDARPPAKRG
ncbi:MAG: response regulator [Acetobacteraceae bacterium]|nr:response regulator [Acetobacteraceae bacterium]